MVSFAMNQPEGVVASVQQSNLHAHPVCGRNATRVEILIYSFVCKGQYADGNAADLVVPYTQEFSTGRKNPYNVSFLNALPSFGDGAGKDPGMKPLE